MALFPRRKTPHPHPHNMTLPTSYAANPTGTRSELADFLRKFRRILKLGRPEVYARQNDPNYDDPEKEIRAVHIFHSALGQVFDGGKYGLSAILDFVEIAD